MQVCHTTLPRPEKSPPVRLTMVRVGQHIFQATNPATFDAEIEQWLNSHTLIALVATIVLLPPEHSLYLFNHGNEMRAQRESFPVTSGTVSTTLDCVHLCVRAPPHLFFSLEPTMLSIWIPTSYWGTVSTSAVVEALHHAACSLLHPSGTHLSSQMLVENFVSITLSSAACTHVNDSYTHKSKNYTA